MDMRIRTISFIVGLVALNIGAAHANWEYSGEYTYNTNTYDNGSRTSISLRGGAGWAWSKMKNDVHSIVSEYYINYETGEYLTAGEYDYCTNCTGFEFAGTGSLGDLKADNLSAVSWTAGASLGWILPNHPQWRLEVGWDHFSEVDYNHGPLFSGGMKLTDESRIYVEYGAIQSTVTTDLISFMAFYDFFDGLYKPVKTMIPYVGIGFGYADSRTVMNLSDPWGNLSESVELEDFGVLNGNIINFYQSKTSSNNIAGVASLGFSYGLSSSLFFDFGARVAYIPRVKYTLVNADGTRRKDWISAKNMLYTSVTAGIRFEF